MQHKRFFWPLIAFIGVFAVGALFGWTVNSLSRSSADITGAANQNAFSENSRLAQVYLALKMVRGQSQGFLRPAAAQAATAKCDWNAIINDLPQDYRDILNGLLNAKFDIADGLEYLLNEHGIYNVDCVVGAEVIGSTNIKVYKWTNGVYRFQIRAQWHFRVTYVVKREGFCEIKTFEWDADINFSTDFGKGSGSLRLICAETKNGSASWVNPEQCDCNKTPKFTVPRKIEGAL